MAKISGLLIGVVLFSLVIGVLINFMADVNNNYNIEYDNTSLQVYNKLNNVSTKAEEIRNASDITEDPDITDVVGGYFASAYTAAKTTADSYETFEEMGNDAIDDANLGKSGDLFRTAFSTILLIIIFLGVLISAIIKKDI
jgi:hypothetical protein